MHDTSNDTFLLKFRVFWSLKFLNSHEICGYINFIWSKTRQNVLLTHIEYRFMCIVICIISLKINDTESYLVKLIWSDMIVGLQFKYIIDWHVLFYALQACQLYGASVWMAESAIIHCIDGNKQYHTDLIRLSSKVRIIDYRMVVGGRLAMLMTLGEDQRQVNQQLSQSSITYNHMVWLTSWSKIRVMTRLLSIDSYNSI